MEKACYDINYWECVRSFYVNAHVLQRAYVFRWHSEKKVAFFESSKPRGYTKSYVFTEVAMWTTQLRLWMNFTKREASSKEQELASCWLMLWRSYIIISSSSHQHFVQHAWICMSKEGEVVRKRVALSKELSKCFKDFYLWYGPQFPLLLRLIKVLTW